MTRPDPENVLSAVRQHLAQLARTVPPGAARFHEKLGFLHARVAGELGRKWPFGPRLEEALALQREAQSLGVVAEGLTGALTRADGVKAGVEQARSTIGRLEDSTIAQWFDQWRASWHFRIANVGRAVDREQDLNMDIQVIHTVEWEVGEVRESVQIFAEAQDLLRRFGGHLKATVLRADLTELREALLREPPGVAWRDAVTRAMSPLLAVANEPAPRAPEDLVTAYNRAIRAESWAEAMRVDATPAEELVGAIQAAQHDSSRWAEDSVQVLVSRSIEVLSHFEEEARSRRASAAKSTSEDLAVLEEACGRLPELAEEIRAVESIPGGDPYPHGIWFEKWQETRRSLLQEAGARRRDIVSWVQTRRTNLVARLGDLATKPLPARGAAERAELDAEIERAGALPESLEEILMRLHAMARWIASTERLEASAREAAAAIEQRRDSVEARHETLHRYERSLGLPAEDWQNAIDDLRAPEGSLESALARLSDLEHRIQTRSAAVVRRCRERVTEDHESCQKATTLVQTVLAGVTPEPPPVWPDDPGAAAAMRLWESTQRTRDLAFAQLERAIGMLASRVPECRSRLEEALLRPDLLEQQRISAEEILDGLAAETWKSVNPIEGLAKLKSLLARINILFSELSSREDQLADLRRRIDGMLANASEEGLGKYAPPVLVERVRLLRRGVPDKPRSLSAAIHQLEGASTLYTRVLDHARRRAVSLFAWGLSEITAEAQRSPAFARREEPLLTEVRALPRDMLPPADVRERVIQLAMTLRPGGPNG